MDAVGHEGADEGAQECRRIAAAARRSHHLLHTRHQRVHGSGPRVGEEREGEGEGEGRWERKVGGEIERGEG